MADSSGIRIVNMNEVVKDFRAYDKNTQKAFRKTMRKFARITKNNQFNNLRAQVIDWTGNLGKSIGYKSYSKKGLIEYHIGPGEKGRGAYIPIYSKFIESGGTPYGNPALKNAFKGYWYVRNSVRGIKGTLGIALKRDIRNSTKK